jgi:small-conductance mechanosensitive channel
VSNPFEFEKRRSRRPRQRAGCITFVWLICLVVALLHLLGLYLTYLFGDLADRAATAIITLASVLTVYVVCKAVTELFED